MEVFPHFRQTRKLKL